MHTKEGRHESEKRSGDQERLGSHVMHDASNEKDHVIRLSPASRWREWSQENGWRDERRWMTPDTQNRARLKTTGDTTASCLPNPDRNQASIIMRVDPLVRASTSSRPAIDRHTPWPSIGKRTCGP